MTCTSNVLFRVDRHLQPADWLVWCKDLQGCPSNHSERCNTLPALAMLKTSLLTEEVIKPVLADIIWTGWAKLNLSGGTDLKLSGKQCCKSASRWCGSGVGSCFSLWSGSGSYLSLWCGSGSGSYLQFDADPDPDPTTHFFPEFGPSHATKWPSKASFHLFILMRIRIQLPKMIVTLLVRQKKNILERKR